ncbi:selenide, water dikinase [Heliomicrobium modesticaldum Ice1]|uniref:Selenide, water dikinase n=1 Tax=Heliobacterium modesticaldum (strain ATCC 51547 / Ice1) TaxID=498761 RepID=B0TAU5_HELMI|nr:selenide, water dikinase [Heliomicrobium modesticaldum Ice1]
MGYLPPKPDDPNLLVGLEYSDDAGVYRLSPDLALVQTVDFFTPIVDDPYLFGQIAAANALSDVYAMGGRPVTALNLVAFPTKTLPMKVLGEILRGGADKVREAGAVLLGGHSIEDKEPKYGLSVTGVVHPDRVWTNGGARPGDGLILTKPLGIGIISTAIKKGKASPDAVAAATEAMTALNKTAAEVLSDFSVGGCTDITGFGLLGHGLEMARASRCSLRIHAGKVPIIPEARDYAIAGYVPGGSKCNLSTVSPQLHLAADLQPETGILLADAITSGGLLVSLPEKEVEAAIAALHNAGVTSARYIGSVSGDAPGTISVLSE